jgi:hypothetical protein
VLQWPPRPSSTNPSTETTKGLIDSVEYHAPLGQEIGIEERMTVHAQKFFAAIISRKRGICIWLAFAVVLALTFFPPWVSTIRFGERTGERISIGHFRYSHAPYESNRWVSCKVDYARMLVEIAVGECFVLALYLTWGRPKGIRG